MKKYQAGALLVILLVLGFFVFKPKTDRQEQKNISAYKSEKNLAITSEEISYFPGASGYFARPEAPGAYPGVVMIHENRGLRPEIKMAAEQLAKEGYMVLAVDLLGKPVETQEEARALTAKYNEEQGVTNMWNAANYLREKGAIKVGSLGWCFGGAQSLLLALSGEELDATVIYYGRLKTSEEALSPIKWPVLGIFAGNDQVVPVDKVNAFDGMLDKLGVENEVYIYPDVGHAFANPSGQNYAPEATADAWKKTKVFLAKHLQ